MQDDFVGQFLKIQLSRAYEDVGVKSSSSDLYVAIVELLPLVVSSCFVVSFFFLLQVLIEMDAFRRKGLKLRFFAVEQSGPELERVRLRRRVHFNYPMTGCDSGFVF